MKEMTNDELPRGWVNAPLAEVVDVLDSKRVPLNSDERERRIRGKSEKDLVPYYGATGQVGFIDDALFNDPLILLGEDGVPFFDPIRHKAYRVSGRTWVNNHAHVLRARREVADERFITAFLNSFDYTGYVSGSTRLKLTQGSMNSIPVTLAPLAEQKRIADKLEAVLGRVDACRARLDRVPALLKRFRQSVLAAATSGKLTEEWRMTNEVNDKWEKVRLKDAADSRLGKMLDKSKNQGIPTAYLRNINVRWFDFDLSDVQELRIPASEAEELCIRDSDVLICEGGEPGRCAIWNGGKNNFVFQKALHRVRVKEGLLPQWLGYSIKDAADSGALAELFTGTTIKHLTGIALSRFEFPLPTLTEQQEIVRRVEDLFAFADRIEARLATAQKTVERLTPATLAKAFRGELVPQDPNDEPASALLKRIRAEEAALPPKTRAKNKSAKI